MMRTPLGGAALLLALLVAQAPAARAQDEAFAGDTRAYLTKLEKLGFAGVVLVARDGEPAFAEGFGFADRERRLRWTPATVSTIGSITKHFTGAAILLLETEGRLRVEDSISKYFPDVPPDKRGITLHQLLTHSSGIVDLEGLGDWDPIGREEFVRRAMAQPLAFPPGTGYDYSNAGYSLLGAIIEQLSGQSWEEFVRSRLFLPHGMYETGYILAQWGDGRLAQGYRTGQRWGTVLERPMAPDGPYWVLRANGGIHSNAWDMLRWSQALMDGRVFSDAVRKKLWAPHVEEPGGTHYGYGWSVQDFGGLTVITHNGGNGIHFADLAIVPETRTIVFVQTNVVADMPVAQSLLGHIAGRLAGNQPYPAVPDLVEVPPAALDSLTGVYRVEGTGDQLRVTRQGGRLMVEADRPQAFLKLHSSRLPDSARAGRLAELMKAILDGAAAGDFGPMSRARGDGVPVERLGERYAEWMTEQEGRLGAHRGVRLVGVAFLDGRDVVLVRYLFERGSADRAYVFHPDVEGRLLGVSGRGLPAALSFVPEGGGRFGSWDGGFNPSKPMRIAREGGRLRLVVGTGAWEMVAVR